MKEGPRENFRRAPHTGGLAVPKPKDYEAADQIDAANPYEAWKRLAEEGRSLRPGDLLEICGEECRPEQTAAAMWIAKYIGFESARWFVPERQPADTSLDTDLPQVSESCSS